MKIDGTAHPPLQTGLTGPVLARPRDNGTPSPSRDSVSLSASSALLQAVEAGIRQAPDFDAARVGAIRQALSEGHYQISAERIANGLTASTLDLLARQQSS